VLKHPERTVEPLLFTLAAWPGVRNAQYNTKYSIESDDDRESKTNGWDMRFKGKNSKILCFFSGWQMIKNC
jgi:hypothetical protein